MLADDIEQRLIRKALLVITDCGRGVNPRQDSRLAGSALRPAFNSQACVCRRNHAIESDARLFVLKNCQRIGFMQAVEWVVRAARADSQTIDEKKKQRHIYEAADEYHLPVIKRKSRCGRDA